MPKLKTKKSAAKRFRVTGSGKVLRRKAFKNHMLQHKSSKRKRNLSHLTPVCEKEVESVRLMMPYM
jgi:large subunit ribosomal protein L35